MSANQQVLTLAAKKLGCKRTSHCKKPTSIGGDDSSSHYTPAYTPRDLSEAPPEDEQEQQIKKLPVQELMASVDSYETVRADDEEDVVLVFDLDFDDIYGQEAEFADEVTAHLVRALGGDNIVIDPGWIKVTKLKRGSIRVYVQFGSGTSCGGRGGGRCAGSPSVAVEEEDASYASSAV